MLSFALSLTMRCTCWRGCFIGEDEYSLMGSEGWLIRNEWFCVEMLVFFDCGNRVVDITSRSLSDNQCLRSTGRDFEDCWLVLWGTIIWFVCFCTAWGWLEEKPLDDSTTSMQLVWTGDRFNCGIATWDESAGNTRIGELLDGKIRWGDRPEGTLWLARAEKLRFRELFVRMESFCWCFSGKIRIGDEVSLHSTTMELSCNSLVVVDKLNG